MNKPKERPTGTRPSGFRLREPLKRLVLVAIPNNCEIEALSSARQAVAAINFVARVTDTPSDASPRPALVVVINGWGRLALIETAPLIRAAFASVPTLAIVTDGSSLALPLDAGFSDCVRWPLDVGELAARFRARIRDLDAAEGVMVALDPDRLTIRCSQVEARLTPGEFGLLKRLLDEPGQWVSSKALLQGSPGKPRAGKMRVAARAYSIRRKLQQEAWRLRGHRTLGYLFETSARATDDDVASKNG